MASPSYVEAVFAALEPLRPNGWPNCFQDDLLIDRRVVLSYEDRRPFGLTVRETGTVIYIEHHARDPHSGRPAAVGWLQSVTKAYAGRPQHHFWWTGYRWEAVADAEELEGRLRAAARQYAAGPPVDQWGATAEDRRMLARHGICWVPVISPPSQVRSP